LEVYYPGLPKIFNFKVPNREFNFEPNNLRKARLGLTKGTKEGLKFFLLFFPSRFKRFKNFLVGKLD